MATLVSAFGSASSAALTASAAFTVPYTNLLSVAPAAGDYVFVALWLTRNAAATQAQSSNGTYASVACGSVYLTCMENTSVPTNLSATSTTLFHQYGVPGNLSANAVNLAVFGAPYTAGMARGITVTGFNAGAATAVLLCTAMAVQGIYTPPTNPRTTWCKTIENGGVVDTTSGSGLAWASNGVTPSITAFGSTKVNNSNLTSAIVDDVVAGAVTGILNLGSAGYQTTDFSTRYSNQEGLFIGNLDVIGFGGNGGSANVIVTNSNNPVPPALSGGPSTWTGKYLGIGQAISGADIPQDTYITGFSYDPNYLGFLGPTWFVNTNNLVTPSGQFWAGAEQPVLVVMFTNNSTTTAATTSVGNTGGTVNNGLTYLDPQGSTMYFTSFGSASGTVGTGTNTSLPTAGRVVVPTYGGNTTLSWTSKPSSTSLAGCTAPSSPLDKDLYQLWMDNVQTGSQFWDCTPVVTNSGNATSPASAPPGIETVKTVLATTTTGFQTGTLVMAYGANRSGISPVSLFGHLRHGSVSSTNFGFGAAFSFKPNKSSIIGTVGEVVETRTTPGSGVSRGAIRSSEVIELDTGESSGAARTLPKTSEPSLLAKGEIQNSKQSNVASQVNEVLSAQDKRGTNIGEKGAATYGTLFQEVVRAVLFSKSNTVTELLDTQSVRAQTAYRLSAVSEILSSTSQKTLLLNTLTKAVTFARGGYVPKLNSITGLGILGQEALGYGNFYPTNNWYNTTLAKNFTKTYVEAGAVYLLSTTENTKATIRNVISSVADVPTSASQRAVTIPRSAAVAEAPTTTSQRSTIRSFVAAVAEILSGENTRSVNKGKVSEVNLTPSGENQRQVAGNVVGSVAEAPKSANGTSKTLARITTVVEALNTVATKVLVINRASEVAEKPSESNTKSSAFTRSSQVSERPTTTSQRSASHSFATTANLLLSATVTRSVGVARASSVYKAIYTTAFAILIKLTSGFVATFTEYPKTEGFTEYPKTETMMDATNAVFTTSNTAIGFQDDGVASYTEGQ